MENNIILSICIPTYNRSSYLETTIRSIVNQKRFQKTEDVEIVICDNCSNDETRKIVLSFVNTYGSKVRYYKNDINIMDLNFERALSHGKGLYLKLNNDTLNHHEGSLDKILQTIAENKQERNILFFSNKVLGIKQNFLCENLNSFVDNVSYWSSWIACFGIWKEDFISFNDFSRCSHLQLTQIDVLFRLINSQRSVYVNNEDLFISLTPSKKGGYDLLTVFLDNYIFLLTEQLINNKLTEKIFISEKKKLLLQFIRPWLVNIKIYPNIYYFKCNNNLRRINSYYKNDKLTLIWFFIYYGFSLCYCFTKKITHYPFLK